MSEWENLEIPELQQKLKDATTYQERSAIRKILHKKQLRGGGGKNIGKVAPSGATVKRRPSRESRSIGVVREVVRKNSDLDLDRFSPDQKYIPSGGRESADTSGSSRSTPDLDPGQRTPKDNGHAGTPPQQEPPVAPAESNGIELQEPAPADREEEQSEVTAVVKPIAQATPRPAVASTLDDEFEEHLTEGALESAIARSSDYNERRDLRTRLRKLRSDKRAGRTVRGRSSENSESEQSREQQDKPADEEAPSQAEVSTTAEGSDPEDSEERRLEQQEAAPAESEDAHEEEAAACKPEAGEIDIVVEDTDHADDADVTEGAESTEQEAVYTDDDKILRKSVTEPTNSIQKGALSGDEGLSDFRTVLRQSPSPSATKQSPTRSEASQLDFRNLLHKGDASTSPKKTLESGEQKYRAAQPRQEDFRGQLKRKVETKDCSSAASKRTVTAKQEDFRRVLKKSEDGGRSPHASLTPSAMPLSPTATGDENAELGVGDAPSPCDGPPRKSPIPPPVKTKPKVSPRPSPRHSPGPSDAQGENEIEHEGSEAFEQAQDHDTVQAVQETVAGVDSTE